MTAYPEKVNLERVFQRMGPRPPVPQSAASSAAEFDSGPWRVVAADGSTSVFDPAEAQPGDDAGQDVPMPSATIDLSEVLGAEGRRGVDELLGRGPAASAPKPGAVVVLDSAGRRPARQPNALAGLPNPPPLKSVIPPQVSPRCRDIDSHLARIIDVWPRLPRGIKAAILAMIETVRQDR